ncbi:MAG: 2-dehydropantoate 2-reductase [Spirochaetes bacterium]|nr:MAG: 2-dehydropantoate 2-reductase [Spirochaetota bacterium]
MKKIERVYLSGLGAVGCVYASMIHDTGSAQLSVIADEDRISRYTRDRITINGKEYGFNFILPASDNPPADLILIAVKQHNLDESIRAIKNFIGTDTIILSLLNGISSEEIIGRAYGMDKILRAFVLGTDSLREGTRVSFTNSGKIVFGADRLIGPNSKIESVKDLFDRTGIAHTVPDDIVREQWWKFMMNVGINQVSAILRAPYGVFHSSAEAQELLRMASMEVLAIAHKKGVNLAAADIAKQLDILRTLSPQGKTSMLQDVEAGRKTEVEIFSGAVMALGRELGVPTPVNEILYKMIRTLEGIPTASSSPAPRYPCGPS